MIRVLTLATLFPNAVRPTLGVFVERQTLGLAASEEVEVEVVAPVGLPVWPLSLHPHYRPLRSLPLTETWKDLNLHRPLYPVRPLADQSRTVDRIFAALRPVVERIRRSFPFDLIDAEYFWPDGPVAMRLAATFGVPFSVKARGSDIHLWGHRPDTKRSVIEAALKADGLLAVSHSLKDDMVQLGMTADKIRVHYTGVDLDLFRPCDRRPAQLALGISGPMLVTPGALIPRKGQAVAIEALTALPQATLIVIGDGPDRKTLGQLADRLGVADRVRFLANRPHDEVPRWLAAADVMLLPTASEGLANVWVEALACGTPVVTTNIPGADEVITEQVGRRVERSAVAMAEGVREMIARPVPQETVRAAAEKFSWTRNSAELVEYFHELVERSRVSKAA